MRPHRAAASESARGWSPLAGGWRRPSCSRPRRSDPCNDSSQKKWILNIKKLQKQGNLKHCESPALSITLKENNYDFQEVQEMIVSAVFPDETSRIIHLKSDYYAKTVSERLSLPHAAQFTKRYL